MRRDGEADRSDGVEVKPASPDDGPILFDVWLRSVRASHGFLTEEDIAVLAPKTRDYLASDGTEFYVVRDESGALAGFMGLGDDEIEALFLAPEHFRRGLGTRLIDAARSMRPGVDLVLDVNEQNVDARRFYEAQGFVVEGRSDDDEDGMPFPVLHMRAPAS